MANLWLPETRQADAERLAMVDRHIEAGKHVDRALKELDPHLSLCFFGDNASAPGIVPGRWHIRRENPTTVDSYWPLETPDGKYREPTMADAERMKGADLWSTDGMRRLKAMRENAEKERAKADEYRAEQRRDEIASRIEIDRDRVKHAKGLRIPGYGLPKK